MLNHIVVNGIAPMMNLEDMILRIWTVTYEV